MTTWLKNIAMTKIMENCDETAWSIVIEGDKEHCDDMGRELCDDTVMEHCDEKNYGAL